MVALLRQPAEILCARPRRRFIPQGTHAQLLLVQSAHREVVRRKEHTLGPRRRAPFVAARADHVVASGWLLPELEVL